VFRRRLPSSVLTALGVVALLPSALQGHRTSVVYAEAPILVISDGSIEPGRLAAISTRTMQTMEARLSIRLRMDNLTVRLCEGDKAYRAAGGLGNTDACYLAPDRVLIRGNDGVQGSLAHEFVHVLLDEQTSGRCPGWLQEGIVNHENRITASGQYPPRLAARLDAALREAINSRPDSSLDTLSRDAQHTRSMGDAFYGASWSATHYLYHKYGRTAVLNAVKAMATQSPDAAFRQTVGKGRGLSSNGTENRVKEAGAVKLSA
jgi:hypothetical protein